MIPLISPSEKKLRTALNGEPTNDLVLSAFTDSNDRVFPQVLNLLAEGQSVTFKLTKKPAKMLPIEKLPDWARSLSGHSS